MNIDFNASNNENSIMEYLDEHLIIHFDGIFYVPLRSSFVLNLVVVCETINLNRIAQILCSENAKKTKPLHN